MSIRKDISGQVIGKWRVLNHSHTKGKIAYYDCICLECGKDYKVDGRNIRSGKSKSCVKCSNKNRKKGLYKNTKYSIEDTPWRYLMKNSKKSAIRRGKEFTIEFEQFKKLVTSNCTYCGIKPNRDSNPLKSQGLAEDRVETGYITHHGIDRIDSSIGYVKSNVKACCTTCNLAKSTMSVEQFKEWIKRIYSNINNF